jgi:sugar lactone lactonase YvrE
MTITRSPNWRGALVLGAGVLAAAPAARAQVYLVQHVAGAAGGGGVTDGFRTTARFGAPVAVAADGKGTLFVADAGNCTIRSISSAGAVTVLAGTPGACGSTDGAPVMARFAAPQGVIADGAGNVYVADTANHVIRKITSAGLTSTLAGKAGESGTTDGSGAAARFHAPTGLARDTAGTLYVADRDNHAIRKVTLAGVVTTLAGTTGERGSSDGAGSAARFSAPLAIAFDAGTFLVADTGNHAVRLVTAAGVVTTLAGRLGEPGYADGTGNAALFGWPSGIAVVGGLVYVADTNNHVLRTVTRSGAVATVAGLPSTGGNEAGQGTGARFQSPMGLASDATGAVFVADTGNRSVRALAASGVVTTVAGLGSGAGMDDGAGARARFDRPYGLAFDGTGALMVSDGGNQTIRRVLSGGLVTTSAGTAGETGGADGAGARARFYEPAGLARDASGNILVADCLNHVIRKISAAGQVSTLAGLAGEAGSADGQGAAARFSSPSGLAMDSSGNIFVADTGNHTIRRITPGGVVTTFAGSAGQSGASSGTGTAARFAYPVALAFDKAGNLLVADAANSVIRRVTAGAAVTTWAGTAGEQGSRDGTGTSAQFRTPGALAVDASDNLWVGDGTVVRRITPARVVTTVLGSALSSGSEDGLGTAARFEDILGLAVDPSGIIYIADAGNHCVRRAVPITDPSPVISAVTPSTAMARGGSEVVISGENFVTSGLNVRFGGVLATDVTVLSPTTIVARVPSGAVGAKSVSVGTGDGGVSVANAFTYAKDEYLRFLAEGATSAFFDMRIALLNPGSTAATADLQFLQRGAAAIHHAVTVPARTRRTVWPAQIAGLASAEFSTVVDSDAPLVVDRTMKWDSRGYGAHAETAVPGAAMVWYLAEGATHSGFDLFYLLQNASATEAAEVDIRYLLPAPAPPLTRHYTVAPASRANVWVDLEEGLAATDVSAIVTVTNGPPIIVERAMYYATPGLMFGAGHESAGITAPATRWFLAEGATGPYFDLFVLVANPGDEDAAVEADFLLPDGTVITKPYTVRASSRFNIWVDLEDARLADTAVSTTIRSTNGVPVVVERAMWWPGNGWVEAHNSAGLTATGTVWALAEGEVTTSGAFVDTYILIANASAYDGRARVTVLFEDGSSASKEYAITSQSRFNVQVASEFAQARGRRFGALVESLGTPPAQFVVERAMYWNALGPDGRVQPWAAGTNAVATRLQ